MSKPEFAGPGRGSVLDRVLEELARRGAETTPYVAPPVERWNAKVIELPIPRWDLERQRAIVEQAMALALKAQQKLRRA